MEFEEQPVISSKLIKLLNCGPILRSGAVVARQAHNLKAVGSNPTSRNFFKNIFSMPSVLKHSCYNGYTMRGVEKQDFSSSIITNTTLW